MVAKRQCREMSGRMRHQQATSADMMVQAGELTSSLMQLLASKKEELNHLTSEVKQLSSLMDRMRVC